MEVLLYHVWATLYIACSCLADIVAVGRKWSKVIAAFFAAGCWIICSWSLQSGHGTHSLCHARDFHRAVSRCGWIVLPAKTKRKSGHVSSPHRYILHNVYIVHVYVYPYVIGFGKRHHFTLYTVHVPPVKDTKEPWLYFWFIGISACPLKKKNSIFKVQLSS